MGRAESLCELAGGRMPERYLKNLGTTGITGQIRLLEAKVAVVGAGALGGQVIELLARQGVGCLRVIDGDTFACHNLNRQILATTHTIGRNKANAAVERVAEINPDVRVDAFPQMLDETNSKELLTGMDVVVDALDTISARRLVFEKVRELRIPLVHAAIAGFTGQVATIFPDDQGVRSMFDHSAGADRGIELELGNPAVTPAVAAALQAQEVVKLITGIGEPLRGRMLYFDLGCNLFEIIQMEQ